MRFMMLMIPKGYEKAEAGAMPSAEMVAEMTKYNEALTKAGVLLALDGLHPPSMGTRVSFSRGKPRVMETLAGFWLGPMSLKKIVPPAISSTACMIFFLSSAGRRNFSSAPKAST